MSTLALVLERHAAFQPEQIALRQGDLALSYCDLWQRVRSASATLRAAGIGPGDRVAWLGLNDPIQIVLLGALSQIGAMLVPLNYRLARPEWERILAHAGVRLLVSDGTCAGTASQLADAASLEWLTAEQLVALPDSVEMARSNPTGQSGADGQAASPPANRLDAEAAGHADAPLLLVYTSGTTAAPRAAVHTQSGLLWNCVISAHAHELTPQDVVLGVLPMFHVGGLCIQVLPALHAGATVVLHPRFEPLAWLQDVQRWRATLSVMVPATLRAVIEHPHFSQADLSSLRLIMAGSSVVPRPLLDAFHARGIPVGQVYGATETGPVSIYLRRSEAMAHAGSAGRAGLHVEVELRDPDGRPVAPGEEGEVCLRAPNLMRGYWAPPSNARPDGVASTRQGHAESARPGDDLPGGWFHSGDLARQDAAGCYWIVGRSKDLIISGGENIHPAEIENLLLECPLVAEASVLSQPDPRWGESVVAVVVPRPGQSLTPQEVLDWLDGRIARFKLPRRVVLMESLPRTALGKVQKGELQSLLTQSAL